MVGTPLKPVPGMPLVMRSVRVAREPAVSIRPGDAQCVRERAAMVNTIRAYALKARCFRNGPPCDQCGGFVMAFGAAALRDLADHYDARLRATAA
jgi:hypothetical protein